MLQTTMTHTATDSALDYLTKTDSHSHTTAIKRGCSDISMILNDDNMQRRGSGGDWVRYNTTTKFKNTQLKNMALVMKFTRQNPLVLTDVQLRTYSNDNSKFTLRCAMMQDDETTQEAIQRVCDEVVHHIKKHDPDMAHIDTTHVADNLVIEVWGDDAKHIKGETGSTLRMTDGAPVGIDTTANSKDGVDVGNFEPLKNVPVTGVIRFEGYYYTKTTDPAKVRIQWGFLKSMVHGELHVLAKVYTDITVPVSDDDEENGDSSAYLALMDAL